MKSRNFFMSCNLLAKSIKGALSGLGQFSETESPLKVMKNAFYFT